MAQPMLSDCAAVAVAVAVMPNPEYARRTVIFMTVFNDAVKLEKQDVGHRTLIGWFQDEVTAMSAAVEHVLINSAYLSNLRKLPELVICSEYKAQQSKRVIRKFKRATRIKILPKERRVVMVPGTWGKTWVRP